MIQLIVCMNMYLGMCGYVIIQQFGTEAACETSHSTFKKMPGYAYGHCRNSNIQQKQ